MWTGPLACLSLSSVDVVDKDQVFRSGIWVSIALVPSDENETPRVKIDALPLKHGHLIL